MQVATSTLVHRRIDGWLLGGVGLLAWVVVFAMSRGSTPAIGGWVTWIFAVVVAMHFGASYHLAYAGGRSALRQHPLALVIIPAALLALGAVVVVLANGWSAGTAEPPLRLLLMAVFTMTAWHYLKQAFGVGLLSLKSHGFKVGRREVLILRYSLYPIWIYQTMVIYGAESASSYRGVALSVAAVPAPMVSLFRVVGIAGAVLSAIVMLRLVARYRAIPPAGLWATYAASALWFLLPPSYISAGIVLGGVHGLQYLACAHRAEINRAIEGGEQRLATWWISVFGGAAAGGLLLSSFLPRLVDGSALDVTMPGMIGSLLFVFLNLHHYAIDATIWRGGGEHVRRISNGPATVPVAAPPALVENDPVPAFA